MSPDWLYHRVLLDVARSTGIAPPAIIGRARNPRIVAARHAVWWILRAVSGLSLPNLGSLVGRHHTSILYAVREPSLDAWAIVLDVLQAGAECAT